MKIIEVKEEDIEFAKNQIKEFEKTPKGKYRYKGVNAWAGVVCEILTSNWLESNFNVQRKAKGVDTSGKYDNYDIILENKLIEIKSATRFYYEYIMPKKPLIDNIPNDIYIGVKYNETVVPNEIHIIGFMGIEKIKTYPVEQNKGVPYYKVPLKDLISISFLKECIKHFENEQR